MEIDARVEAWATLQLVAGLGAAALVTLLKAFGGPAEVLAASRAGISKLVAAPLAASIKRGPDPEALANTLSWLAHPDNSLVTWDDPDYPQMLLSIADPPPALYYIGRRALLNRPAVAIVGSRNATPQGLENAEAFGAALSSSGVTVVSGLAIGIDAAAHRGGLSGNGSSLAVIGTGIDRVYPARNRDLAHTLAEKGGVLSQFSLGTAPLSGNFPRRNRVISGLARGVLVVEATLNSGSLITARAAAEQGREVFAIPGSIHSPFSRGSHRLIKDGAKLVETAQDILEELGALGPIATPSAGAADKAKDAAGSGDATRILAALGSEGATVDRLVERSGLSSSAVTVALLELELRGQVAALPGGAFQRIH